MKQVFGISDVITNGSSAGRVIALVVRDKSWGTAGVRIENIGLERFGGNVGQTSFVPHYLLTSWRLAPMDWTPVRGGGQERYVWVGGHSRLRREVRATP